MKFKPQQQNTFVGGNIYQREHDLAYCKQQFLVVAILTQKYSSVVYCHANTLPVRNATHTQSTNIAYKQFVTMVALRKLR